MGVGLRHSMNAAFNSGETNAESANLYFIFWLFLSLFTTYQKIKKIVHLGPTLGNSKHENANPLN